MRACVNCCDCRQILDLKRFVWYQLEEDEAAAAGAIVVPPPHPERVLFVVVGVLWLLMM